MKDFSFQGRIELASRLTTGNPGNFIWVGDQSSCELSFNSETTPRTETFSGQRLQSAVLRTATTVSGTLVLRYFNTENLKLGLYATEQNVTGTSVVDEIISSTNDADLGIGKRFALAKPYGVSAITVKDSASVSAHTLLTGQSDPNDNEYIVEPDTFIIRQLKAGSPPFTAPLTASYTHATFSSLPMFTTAPPERWLRMSGVNTAGTGGERLTIDLYKVQFNPFSSLPMINEDFGELTLEFTALFDADKALDPNFGGFGRLMMAP